MRKLVAITRMSLGGVISKAGSGGVVINAYRPDGSLPSLPMARIKVKQAAAGKAAAKKPAQGK